MNSLQVKQPTFQWNAGGWFGSQLGSTCWMFIFSILLLKQDQLTAAAVFGCFLGSNIIGTCLWMARRRIDAYPGIQILMAVCWVSSLTSIYLIENAGLWNGVSGVEIDGVGGKVSAGNLKYMLIFLFPIMMVFFHGLNRQSRKAN